MGERRLAPIGCLMPSSAAQAIGIVPCCQTKRSNPGMRDGDVRSGSPVRPSKPRHRDPVRRKERPGPSRLAAVRHPQSARECGHSGRRHRSATRDNRTRARHPRQRLTTTSRRDGSSDRARRAARHQHRGTEPPPGRARGKRQVRHRAGMMALRCTKPRAASNGQRSRAPPLLMTDYSVT